MDRLRFIGMIFISYSRQDRDFVERLSRALKVAGVQTWTNVESIPAGANWQNEIEKDLIAYLFIVLSGKSNVSLSGQISRDHAI